MIMTPSQSSRTLSLIIIIIAIINIIWLLFITCPFTDQMYYLNFQTILGRSRYYYYPQLVD